MKFIFESWYVANHLKTLIPVGTAIIIVADVKYARVSTSNPTVNNNILIYNILFFAWSVRAVGHYESFVCYHVPYYFD